jgi:tetratricopeptide (TPR) repeat protein
MLALFCRVGIAFAIILAASGAFYGRSASSMADAYQLGSKLGLAGAFHAQGDQPALAQRQFAEATAAATALGIKLPPLPKTKGNKIDDTATVLAYLLNSTGNPIGAILNKNFGGEHGYIFEIALKSNILLMLYGPGDSTSNTILSVLRDRSTKSNIVGGLTEQLIVLIDRKATFDAVKQEVFAMNDRAPKLVALIDLARQGESKYKAGDSAGSAAAYTKALAIDPTGAEYYFGRARAYGKLDKTAEAIADYTKAIQLEKAGDNRMSNLTIMHHNRGLLRGMLKQNALALADLNEAIRLRPDYASAFRVRGLLYRQMGNAKASAADLAKAEQLQPGITK